MWTAERLAARLAESSADGIARSVARLVSTGEIEVGTRLPTVRALARSLRVSPTTVSEAWRSLSSAGVVETGGRRGTTVRGRPQPAAATRFSKLHHNGPPPALDLSTGTPDPDLLPDLGPAMHKLSRHAAASSYFDAPVLPELEEVLRADWPFRPAALTMVDGAMDAIDRVFEVVLRFGDRVLVENPTFPPILDLLEERGITVLGLPLDAEGVRPDALADAVAGSPPAALVIQPRAQNPSGHTMSDQRAMRLASILGVAKDLVIIEDDHGAPLSTSPPVSLGSYLPEQTVHVRGFSKSHGPDLRLAALGGVDAIVEKVLRRRLLGPAWSSRLLQALLLHLLTDPASVAEVAHASRVYAQRRGLLTEALTGRGVRVAGGDGINLWIEVRDETAALVALAVNQITAAPGSPFLSAPLAADHIRVTCAGVRGDIDQLAGHIAAAALPAGSPYRAN
ncbi:aminotransferase class I/II-fold pyridoxal phosphate-dependent enzyme [Amycolatopsis aidingensis]|uniref:aminotransferase class I/II-fold pyridoxal phosphate-dependent enzyme n=1 Tax=Amycolatopsis aidingensis TaxID=2842453 RepID=UPI001C0BB3A6|nr:aminotransferase class I/II-fold pyridoxal phosphate-dependent enzyme [Amycolatopsis aidingensis]